jgi:hypothetical protein
MTRMMRTLVKVQGGFRPSVMLPDDFDTQDQNEYFASGYIPTQETLEVLLSIKDSLQPGALNRARLFAGTFGTGKSDLMLLLANYLSLPVESPLLVPFFSRVRNLSNATSDALYRARSGKPPFLVVVLQAKTATSFSSFAVDGLSRALAKVGLGDLLNSTYYRAALDQIATWQSGFPENLERLDAVLINDFGQNLTQLKVDLAGPHADSAYSTFCSAVERALGMVFYANATIQSPSDAYTTVAKQLTVSNKYSGVVLLIDEFTPLLQKLADDPTGGDAKAIDNLAEAATRSGANQLHFYAVSLFGFASVQGQSKLAQDTIERVGGRFTSIALRSLNSEELIGATIEKLVPTAQVLAVVPGQLDDLVNVGMRFWGAKAGGKRNRDDVKEKIVEACFPLHPLATYCLPRLNAVMAQNERTMFSYIRDGEKGLGRFIEDASGDRQANGWFPLVSVDALFTYFETNLSEKRGDLNLAYQQAVSSLHPEDVQGDAGKLLRALVLLEVVGGDPNLRVDRDLLRHAVGFAPSESDRLAKALVALEQAGVAYPSQSGYYQLVRPGRANPMELKRQIERMAQNPSASVVEMLNAKFKPTDIEAQKYNDERGTWRTLSARFVTPAGLASPAILNMAMAVGDGLLYYVLARSDAELVQARATAIEVTREYEQLVVAVPRAPSDLETCYRRKAALEDLRKQADYQSSDCQDLLADTGIVGRDYQAAFSSTITASEQPSNYEWYCGGRTETVTTPAHLSDLAGRMMRSIFGGTPAQKARQHLKPGILKGVSRKYVTDALDKLLNAPFTLKQTGKTPVDLILVEGAGGLGLVAAGGRENGYIRYNVQAPASQVWLNLSRTVWQFIDSGLASAKPWHEIVERLQEPPYGLYDSVLELYMAAFYWVNREFMEVARSGALDSQPVMVNSDTIIAMVEDPKKFDVRYQRLTEPQRKLLHALVERALCPETGFGNAVDSASLRNRTATRFRKWAMVEVPFVAKQSHDTDLALVMQSASATADTVAVACALLNIIKLKEDSKTAAALLDTLPGCLGLADDSNAWTDDDLGRAFALLESACAQLDRFQANLRQYIVSAMGDCFGVGRPAEATVVLEAAVKWRGKMAIAKAGLMTGTQGNQEGRDLLESLETSSTTFDRAFLNSLSSRFFGNGLTFDQWRSMADVKTFLEKLALGKATVETKAVQVRPPALPKVPPDGVNEGKQPGQSPEPGGTATPPGKAQTTTPGQGTGQPSDLGARTPNGTSSGGSGEPSDIEGQPPNPPAGGRSTIRELPDYVTPPQGTDPERRQRKTPALDNALQQIKAITAKLTKAERRELLQLLTKELESQ